jgi:hypothetical protein
MELALRDVWPALSFLVGFIVWLVRLEGKTLNNDRRISHAEQQIENIENGLTKQLGEVKQALARIEGYLKAKAEERSEHE